MDVKLYQNMQSRRIKILAEMDVKYAQSGQLNNLCKTFQLCKHSQAFSYVRMR